MLRKVIVFLFLFFTHLWISAQDFMIQGWYWDYPKVFYGHNFADTLLNKMDEIHRGGFTFLWMPPHTNSSWGTLGSGYEPKDLYDIGEYEPTMFGNKTTFDKILTTAKNKNIQVVADLVFNHRDGGLPENNPAVKGWIKNFNNPNNGPYPSDRVRAILPIGGNTGRGAGDYYIAFRSATGHSNFAGKLYQVLIETRKIKNLGLKDTFEFEPNNAYGQFNLIKLGRRTLAHVDANGGVDEFKLTLTSSDFEQSGDTLFIWFGNRDNNYSDHFIWNGDANRSEGLWYDSDGSGPLTGTQTMPFVEYQTFTLFNARNIKSGKAFMDYRNFKPNGNPTNLGGYPSDYGWDAPLFFYDYDHNVPDTRNKLIEWAKWNFSVLGFNGMRVGDVKHFDPAFMAQVLNNLHTSGFNPPMVVGEWFESNGAALSGWVNNVMNNMTTQAKSKINVRVFDFLLRDNLRQACDVFGYDVRNVFNNNLKAQGLSGFNIVSFVNNHHFRRNTNEPTNFFSLIKNDPILAYAFILTNNQLGVPSVYYLDYFGYKPSLFDYHPKNVRPMQEAINQLIAAHQTYIYGANTAIYLNNFGSAYLADANYISGGPSTTLLYQLNGAISGKKVVVAINFAGETLKLDHRVDASIGTKFTDVLGKSKFPFAIVDNLNRIYIEIPPRSYSIWVEGDTSPLKPTNLTIDQIQVGSIRLQWQDNSSNEKYFAIERKKVSENTWNTIATVSSNVVSFQQTANLELGNSYVYRVKAVNNIGSSKYSNEQILNYIKPNTPSNIQATTDNNRIIISWLPDTNEIIIERKKLEDENFNKIANIKSAHSYIDSINIEEGQSYVYRLKAYNGALYSDYSEEKTVSFSTLLFNEKSNIDVKITPNPTSGTIDVNSNLQYSDYKLVIYTIFDTKIFEQDIKTNTYSVDLGKFSDGVYIVSLIFEKSQLTQKLIIKK